MWTKVARSNTEGQHCRFCWFCCTGITVLSLFKEMWCHINPNKGGGEKNRRKKGLIHVQWPGKYSRLTQTMKNHEDWWHKDNGATADLFSLQKKDTTTAWPSLITRPIFIPAAIHGCIMSEAWKLPGVHIRQGTKQNDTTVHLSQGWWWG